MNISVPELTPTEPRPNIRASLLTALRERLHQWVYPLLSILSLMMAWEVLAFFGIVDVVMLPPPSRFLGYLWKEKFSLGIGPDRMNLWTAIAASFLRALTGLALGFFVSIGLGIAISLSKTLSRLIIPIIQICAPISPVAWIPFSIVLFGIGNATAVFIVFVGIVFLLTLATISAIQNVDRGLLRVSSVLGTKSFQLWRYVIIPAILPQVFILLRMNFFAAWMAVLAAEMVGTKSGLGAIILIGRESFNMTLILIGMSVIGVCGWLIDSLLAGIQRRFFWWQSTVVN